MVTQNPTCTQNPLVADCTVLESPASLRDRRSLRGVGLVLAAMSLLLSCTRPTAQSQPGQDAATDSQRLLLTHARVYSLSWPDPATDGIPAPEAPQVDGVWHPDAEAVLVEGGRISWLGSAEAALERIDERTRVIDLAGATVLPGLVDSHTHVRELGARLRRVDLVGATSEPEVLARLRQQRPDIGPGEWILGWGWDDGAWAERYPTWEALSEAYPDNPVALHSLHGFALWGNRLAFERAGLGRQTPDPVGGELIRKADGELTGVLLNRATALLADAIPQPSGDDLQQDLVAGLEEMSRSGYVSIHEAGLDEATLQAFAQLHSKGALPLRVYGMLSARDAALLERYIARGPDCDPEAKLRICSVKAYWDGALGSRGARLLEDYSDRPGHRGISGDGYGFDQELVERAIAAGFQAAVHAIGDAGNRETLDFLSGVLERHPSAQALRHRIEHAQVVHPDDLARFGELDLIASMQPPHLAEDKGWAEERLGPERVHGAYAWRSLRRAGAELVFSSDLAGSDHDFFYGLHSAVTRRSPDGTPPDGWLPEEAVTVEEALRAYTTWAARAAFLEDHTGMLTPGRFADLTVIDLDPFATAREDPAVLLNGRVLLTLVGGQIVWADASLASR